MKKITIVVLLLFVLQLLHGQETLSPLPAPYTHSAVYSEHFTDAFSGAVNQAALAHVTSATAGVYSERRFMLRELSSYAAALSIPSKLGGFGVAIHYFGSEHFNTSQIGLGYGKKLSDKISIGIQFNYNMIRLSGYGSSSAINVEAGALLRLTEKVHVGIHVYNPMGGKFGKMGAEKLASVYTTGIGYEVAEKLLLSAEISKPEDHDATIFVGVQYNFAAHFFARLGVSPAPGNVVFGLGIQWKTFRIDAVSSWQPALGFTPGIMMLFNFHEDKPLPALEN